MNAFKNVPSNQFFLGDSLAVTKVFPDPRIEGGRFVCKLPSGSSGQIFALSEMKKETAKKGVEFGETFDKLKQLEPCLPKIHRVNRHMVTLPSVCDDCSGKQKSQGLDASIVGREINYTNSHPDDVATVQKTVEGQFTKLPLIHEQMMKREPLPKRTKKQAMMYLLWNTPPLRSIYVRWAIPRSKSLSSNSSVVIGLFEQYGPIERVVDCTINSAIVVFTLIRSACYASARAGEQLPVKRLFVQWLPEYLDSPIQKQFS